MSGWIYKLVGGASVFLFAWVLRGAVCRETDGATEQLDGYLLLFEMLRRGIAYESAPIDELLARCDPALIAACTGNEGEMRVSSLSALSEQTAFLSEGLEEVVADAAVRMGRGYREEQLTACDKYIASLTTLVATHKKKCEERTQMLGTLIYTVAAALVLLLL